MTILTANDVRLAMRKSTLTPDEADLIEMYIEAALGEIEAYLGRPVEVREFTENVWADADGAAYFENTPVVSVSELIVNGTTKDPTFYTITKYGLENVWDQFYTLDYSPSQVNTDFIYGPQITVTYCAGLGQKAIPAVRGLILSAVTTRMFGDVSTAERAADGSLDVKRIEVEDFRVEYQSKASGSRSTGASNYAMFESEFDFVSIKRFKRRSFG